ncbi:tRNA (adenosine(37)-N6)-threonylcarbamoyltransferase complex dimerization subunit type 1 TsaB [Pseudonocardia sp. GCM10023141]|uniref:tRNA (adenosine(37)-N6)-threonylcarbamoyltransferase complex dimerization subunit type 1 TsaB n=1 Tax=Pseudonocardia sp. GCM10023141 TaxID=3252653 RepID=UPI00361D5B21
MLVLALDTATPAVTAGVVELTADGLRTRGASIAHDPRKHGELLIPGVLAACAEAGITLQDIEAVVTGIGPGPFTGLRVGMVTAASLGDALGVPVHGVCSHDAIAAEVVAAGPFLVVTDARRREVYWAAYNGTGRTHGPAVDAPAVLAARVAELGVVAAAGALADTVGLPVLEPSSATPEGLVAVAADALRTGADPGLLEPLYLRRPDAQEMSARKRVTTG